MVVNGFGGIRFAGKLRPSQNAASSIIRRELESGNRRLHIVAPPGSGKTILGLYVWSDMVRLPTLVLSPNSAIQAQWAARTSLFDLDGKDHLISTDPKAPGLLNSLTYQSLTLPIRGSEELDQAAVNLWAEKLVFGGQVANHEVAAIWQNDLKERNPDYFKDRMSFYRKIAREGIEKADDPLWSLHSSSRENIDLLKRTGIGLVILDECHHLLHHWGTTVRKILAELGDPIVLGLTATPPSTNDPKVAENYLDILGELDYQVPVPALVRDRNLAPYQDLVHFVRPTSKELKYIAQVDEKFVELLEMLRAPREGDTSDRIVPLEEWIHLALSDPESVAGVQFKEWPTGKGKTSGEDFLNQARLHLLSMNRVLPEGVPHPPFEMHKVGTSDLDRHTPLIDRYVRYGLRRSVSPLDHELGQEAIDRLRLLGRQITETGVRPAASPVGRVMGYSEAKTQGVLAILKSEMQDLGSNIRAVIVTDFEKTSSMALVEGVLDEEAGGAVAVFRNLVEDESTDLLNPILMTGSTVLVDDDLAPVFIEMAEEWVESRGLDIKIFEVMEGKYHDIRGSGPDWVPRNYIEMITEMFQHGITNCIVGTRGLLGEGWDASRINVLIDLTNVTTDMSINQLRGRSIRLDKHWPEKVANNWDIICIAEEFAKGFDDYDRFKKKHSNLYGVCDDSAIEKGVGHVHPAFKEIPELGISEGMNIFNDDMFDRARNRQKARDAWKIGTPFDAEPRSAIELLPPPRGGREFPLTGDVAWTEATLVHAIGTVVLKSLQKVGHLPDSAEVEGGDRGGGWVRFHLENCTEEESEIFCTAMKEVLGPLDRPRYVIPRSSRFLDPILIQTFLSKYFPFLFDPKEGISERIEQVMLHAVPKIMSSRRVYVEIFEIYWNMHVSPGKAMYGHSKAAKEEIAAAKNAGLSPDWGVQEKSVYL